MKKGVSFYIAIGHPVKPAFNCGKIGCRVALWYIAVNLCFYDIEQVVGAMIERFNKLENENGRTN
jgi:hypothetical protein